jgi:MtN3 and saliva related transmembrane protein
MPNFLIRLIELVFGLAMILNAIVFIPQALKLYKVKNANGISLTMFVGFNFIQCITILHGYVHKDYILMYGYILTLFLSGIVTFLVLLYKNNK